MVPHVYGRTEIRSGGTKTSFIEQTAQQLYMLAVLKSGGKHKRHEQTALLVIYSDGNNRMGRVHHKRHREDGPAITYAHNSHEWCLTVSVIG